jgi:hypothetical protein
VDSFGRGGVMMWAAISNDRKTDLVHVSGNVTTVRYRKEILQAHHMHVIDRQRELFQLDNARPHTVRAAMDYLEQNILWDQLDKRYRMAWPHESSSLSLCRMAWPHESSSLSLCRMAWPHESSSLSLCRMAWPHAAYKVCMFSL